jgi:hypothetical protein
MSKPQRFRGSSRATGGACRGLGADIHPGDEVEFFLQRLLGGSAAGVHCLRIAACVQLAPVLELDVAPQDFEARADLVDAVVHGLELGALVEDRVGAKQLAAVVQPSSQAEGLALALGHRERGKGAGARRHGFVEQGQGKLGHAVAVSAGVGRTGSGRFGQQGRQRVERDTGFVLHHQQSIDFARGKFRAPRLPRRPRL